MTTSKLSSLNRCEKLNFTQTNAQLDKYLSHTPKNSGSLFDYENGKRWIDKHFNGCGYERERLIARLTKHLGV